VTLLSETLSWRVGSLRPYVHC